MSNATILGNIMWEVLKDGQTRTLKQEEVANFYMNFHADVSEKIDEIRSEQRRAYEEERNLILS
ncbi:MAG: hypothetical protein WC825_05935 [Gallionellaceae bacterium]|jgi:hypothetical protein